MRDELKLDLFTETSADVFLSGSAEERSELVQKLDERGFCVIGDFPDLPQDEDRMRRIMSSCSAVVAPAPRLEEVERIASELRIPVYSDAAPEIAPDPSRMRPYAFLIGRLERDFAQAREAIRIAVENEAGIACLWSDDRRHRTNVDSVRERTRLLIKHSTFVIAELTLGIESPDRENPSRAHEIGLAIGYERKVMLSSQEPRRYPYFSIADLQMTFWDSEDELEQQVRAWIRSARESVARVVCNPKRATFTYDPKRRYVGPKTRALAD
ncbi:MAG TPA: hypothetical protein VGQ36_14690 [Thermoanaerobaculia bacterium]|jgi:hypothetical protein|nr:hypothetical protein [Thermoanaerobaculia bacterium]